MTKILSLTILLILGISLTGCPSPVCEPTIVDRYVYIDKPIPDIKEKPKTTKPQVLEVNFNGKDYIVMEKGQAAILDSNWESYRGWSEENFNILKSLKDSNSSK